MRAMRDAGARGLAGLAADAPGVARPFLELSRATIRRVWQRPRRSVCRRSVERVATSTSATACGSTCCQRSIGSVLGLRRRCSRWPSERRHGASRSTRSLARFVSEECRRRRHSRCQRRAGNIRFSSALRALAGDRGARSRHPRSSRNSTSGTVYHFGRPRGSDAAVRGRRGLSASRYVCRSVAVRRHGRRRAKYRSSGVVRFGEWRFRPVRGGRESPTSGASERHADEGRRVHRRTRGSSDLPADRRLSVRAWHPADRMRAASARGGTSCETVLR